MSTYSNIWLKEVNVGMFAPGQHIAPLQVYNQQLRFDNKNDLKPKVFCL